VKRRSAGGVRRDAHRRRIGGSRIGLVVSCSGANNAAQVRLDPDFATDVRRLCDSTDRLMLHPVIA
jgi:hypothetical protein